MGSKEREPSLPLQQGTISLAFEGDNRIDAKLLGEVLSNLSFVIDTIAKNAQSVTECSLSIETFEKGSFCIPLIVLMSVAGQLCGLYSIRDISGLFSIVKGAFDIKQFLAGRKPKAVIPDEVTGLVKVLAPDGTEVVAPCGSQITISNSMVDKSLSSIARASKQHNPNGGFRLEHDGDVTKYNGDAVDRIAAETPEDEIEPITLTKSIHASLPIKSLNLLGNGRWSFVFQGKTISATIEDKEFLNAVHQGKHAYKAGDSLDVQLRIDSSMSEIDSPLPPSYAITKVYDLLSGPRQLFFDKE